MIVSNDSQLSKPLIIKFATLDLLRTNLRLCLVDNKVNAQRSPAMAPASVSELTAAKLD